MSESDRADASGQQASETEPSPSRWKAILDWLRPPNPSSPPHRFPQGLEELRTLLATDDGDLANELLNDAERLFAEADARVDSAERRATTLQGSVAIAATVVLAGASLLVDPTKVPSHGWRIALTAVLAFLVLSLVASALFAVGATSRAFAFTTPSDDDIFVRAQQSPEAAKARRAAYLLHGYGRNNEVAAIKVSYLKRAAACFRFAVIILGVLAVVLFIYVVTVDNGGSASPQDCKQQARRDGVMPHVDPRCPHTWRP